MYNKPYSPSHGTSSPNLNFVSLTPNKTRQLAYVLWIIIRRRAKDLTPQTTSSVGTLILHSIQKTLI